MKGDKIRLRKGYKYSLWDTYCVQLPLIIGYEVDHRLFKLDKQGWLTIHEDYPWDGASGPTWDSASTMRGSLVHDALFEMIRLGFLPASEIHNANLELWRICVEDGMLSVRARIWLAVLDKFGWAAAVRREESIITAP